MTYGPMLFEFTRDMFVPFRCSLQTMFLVSCQDIVSIIQISTNVVCYISGILQRMLNTSDLCKVIHISIFIDGNERLIYFLYVSKGKNFKLFFNN